MSASPPSTAPGTPLRDRLIQGAWLGALIGALLILLNAGGFFTSSRLALSNLLYVPGDISPHIVIVALDDASLEAYGRSPTEWSRGLHAQLVEQVNQAGARVLAFDLLFAEPSFEDTGFADALQSARESDNRLRVVMPLAGVEGALESPPGTLTFADALRPTTLLRDQTDYLGYVNVLPDADANIRRQPSQVQVGTENGLSFPLVVYAAWLRIPPEALASVISSAPGRFTLAERTVPVDERGLWMQNYFSRAHLPETPDGFQVVSYREVMNGNIPPETFADKIVMVGVMRSTALSDEYYVPVQTDGRKMTGVEIHANAVETLIQDRPLQAQSPLAQALMIGGLALLASLLYAALRWGWALPLMLGLLALAFVAASFLMSGAGLVINLLYAGMALALPAAARLGAQLIGEIRRRQQSEYLLGSAVTVTDQRLQLDRTLAEAVTSVEGLLGSRHVAVWLLDASGQLQARHHSEALRPTDLSAFDSVLAAARQSGGLVEADSSLAVPLRQDSEVIGMIAAAVRQPLSPERRRALEAMAVQVMAGGVANALLYDRLGRQKALLETTFETSPAGLLELDRDLRIVRGNLSADRALMASSQSFAGLNIDSLLTAAGVDEGIRISLREAFRQGAAFRREISHQGRTYTVEAAPLPGQGGWVLVMSDVSPLMQLNETRTRLLRIASHDLKNPLTRVRGYADLMIEGIGKSQFTDKDRDYIKGIISGTYTMQDIIDEILNTERMRAGKLDFHTLDVLPMVQEVLQRHQEDAADKGLVYQHQIPESAPCIRGDRPQLIQAMSNLVSNGIKYSREGGTVTVRLLTAPALIRFEVQDTGYGIPVKDQPRIFEEFTKLRTKETINIPGTGLGLSLAKAVVDSHGGTIGFHSEEGKGSTFFIELPVAPQEPA
jgi:signal transduction histidine kinase/CHASE2 domain-containing sensor protein